MADLNGNQEFEERDPQLPFDPRKTLPADVLNTSQNLAAAARTPAGEPPMDYNVRSVFDSRPVQGFDFNIFISSLNVPSTGVPIVFTTVPQGMVMVLRSVDYWMEPLTALTSRRDVTMSITRNAARYRYNVAIPVGVEKTVNTFLLADQFDQVGVQWVISTPFAGVNLFAILHGNFIVKTQRAFEFEIANPVGSPLQRPALRYIPPEG